MYTDFYGLKELPFKLSPDPRFIYFSASHEEAQAQMAFGINMKRGFIVITGEVGTGKTTLIYGLLDKLDKNIKTTFLFHAILGARGLILSICKQFGVKFSKRDTKNELTMKLYDFLISNHKSGGNAALIIDEAQNLKPHILEEIRFLSNLETSQEKLLQILLVGQPEFGKILDSQKMRQLKQRISLRHHLLKLNRYDTEEYINHRIRIAGRQSLKEIFSTDAIDEIYDYTNGLPRAINILCDNAMLMGYSMGAQRVVSEIIKRVKFEDIYHEMDASCETVSVASEFEQSQQQDINPGEIDFLGKMPDANMKGSASEKISFFKRIKKSLLFFKKRKRRTPIQIS